MDMRRRLSPDHNPSGRIATVAIDRSTVEKLGQEPSATNLQHAFEVMLQAHPLAIVYTLSPFRVTGSYAELTNLAKFAEAHPEIYFLTEVAPLKDAAIQMNPPFKNARVLVGPITRDLKSFAADDVTRRAIISSDGITYAHTLLAELDKRSSQQPHELLLSKNADQKVPTFRGEFMYRGSPQIYIDFHRRGTYKPLSFMELMNGAPSLPTIEKLANKIVFVGRDAETETDDYVRSPFSTDALAMSKLEAHASILDTLILNRGVIKSPAWLDAALTFAVSILTTFVVFSMSPAMGLSAIACTAVFLLLASYIAFAGFGVWIGISHALLALFIPYYFFIPYRLIQEYRKRWEYQQKHALLSQVEELKTNFMSMMSHDLRTPLARIQGMADMALQDTSPLSDLQKNALTSITRSTEELSKFVSSVLNLTRIESKDIKLHKQSRDVNTILEEVIKKYEDFASTKNIEIITEFDPIFSIRIDVDLMKQVFSNLVENAIKYSQPGTKILVSTEEAEGHIIVQVADQGVGIPADEAANVFLKFYRSKDAKSSPVKGSGLGLYLSKYFVELHGGKIGLESVPRQGSTFTVELPMESIS